MKPLFACSQRAQVECLDQKKCFKSRDTVSITKNLIHCLAQPLRGSLCTVSMFSMNHNALYVHLEQSTYDRLMRWISVLFREHWAMPPRLAASCPLSISAAKTSETGVGKKTVAKWISHWEIRLGPLSALLEIHLSQIQSYTVLSLIEPPHTIMP